MIRAKQLANKKHEYVIVDRTNLTKKSRKAFIDAFKNTHRIIAIILPTPKEEEHERRLNNRPGKNIPAHVLESMRNSYEMPSIEEGPDEVYLYNEN
jgi:tRNA uridine 5-carbamoylmethylation protein Kti12